MCESGITKNLGKILSRLPYTANINTPYILFLNITRIPTGYNFICIRGLVANRSDHLALR